MKIALGFVTLLTIGICGVHSQESVEQCAIRLCSVTVYGPRSQTYQVDQINKGISPYADGTFNRIKKRQVSVNENPPARYETPSYNQLPPSYEASTEPPKILNPGRVIVMPPPGKAPPGYPQPGQPGGGALPETNPYIANMAPDGTVPIAIFPPFEKDPLYPTKCVIYSELTDFEDLEINDYGNINLEQENTYSAPPPPPATNHNLYSDPALPVNNAYTSSAPLQFHVVNTTNSYFRLGRRDIHNNNRMVRQSYYAPPLTTTEAPPRVVYRYFGYTCEIVVSIDICNIGTECDANGNELKSKNRFASYGRSHDRYQSRAPTIVGGKVCVQYQANLQQCRDMKAEKERYQGTASRPSG